MSDKGLSFRSFGHRARGQAKSKKYWSCASSGAEQIVEMRILPFAKKTAIEGGLEERHSVRHLA